jgi:hypothetical protein
MGAVMFLVAPVPATAGPWAQPEGSVFLSVTLNAQDDRAALATGQFDADPTLSIYGELGLGASFTAGLELDWGTSSEMGGVFVRYTLTEPSAPVQIALDAGLSQRSVDGRPTDRLVRLGAALGAGFGANTQSPFGIGIMQGGGWLSLDAAAFLDGDGTLATWRTETTLGVHLNPRLRAVFALKAEEWPQGPVLVTARPSVVFSVAEETSVQAGLVAGLRGSEAVGLSLSIWQEF